MVAKGYPSQPREKIRSWFREERVFQSSRSLRSYNIAPVPRIETYPRDGAVRKDTEDRRSLVNIEKSCGNFRTTLIFYEPSSVHVIHTAPMNHPHDSFLFFFFLFFSSSSSNRSCFTVELANFLSTTRKSHKRGERERESSWYTRQVIYIEREREKKRRTSERGATKLKEV